MKAIVQRELGSPDVLRYEDVPEPIPGDTDVLIDVEVATIEGGDHVYRTVVPIVGEFRIVGFQGAGTVVAIGKDVKTFRIGQRVTGFNMQNGSYATRFVAPASMVFAVPDGLDLPHAATIPTTFATADEALFEFGQLQARETVFINGGAGGVGLAAIQLAKAAGAQVFATARSPERAARLEAFGADHGIAYESTNYADEVLRLTGGHGADLVIDLVGGDADAVARLLSTVRNRGRLGVIGAASGTTQTIGFWDLISKNLTVYGMSVDMGAPRVRAAVARHLASAEAGALQMPIEARFPLSRAADAHRHAERQRPFGRIVLVRDEEAAPS